MNFLADENVEKNIVDRLRRDGHSVSYITELEPGISDDEVLKQANELKAVLITSDKDFGELVYRLGQAESGVILLRLGGLEQQVKEDTVTTVVTEHSDSIMESFTVISPGLVRIRKKVS